MTPRRLRALREHGAAFDHLVTVFSADEGLCFDAAMAAIGECNATFANVQAVQVIEEADARSVFTLLVDRAFW